MDAVFGQQSKQKLFLVTSIEKSFFSSGYQLKATRLKLPADSTSESQEVQRLLGLEFFCLRKINLNDVAAFGDFIQIISPFLHHLKTVR